jgi:hypothetical protein
MWKGCFGTLTMGAIRMKYANYNGLKTVCWTCGIPGDRRPEYSDAVKKCSGRDIVLPVVLYFWQQMGSLYHMLVRKALKRSLNDLTTLGKELVRKERVLEENGSMGFKIWLEILKLKDGRRD